MTTNTAQTVSGAKTFLDTTYRLRNQANDATLTFTNPVFTGDGVGEFDLPFKHCIYKGGSNYKLMNGTTRQVTTSTTFHTLMTTALAAAGTIIVMEGTYLCADGGGFAGWNVLSDTSLIMSPGAQIQPPGSDYTSYIFRLVDNTSNVYMQGGKIIQGGATPPSNWDCILLEASNTTTVNAGIYKNVFRNIYAKRCKSIAHLKSNGSVGWINGNWFENCWVDYARTPFLFDQAVAFVDGVNGMNANSFIGCVAQADTAGTPQTPMTNGYKDISGRANSFVNCKAWDTTSGNSDSNTTVNATNTMIIGSRMTRMPTDWKATQDLGVNTMIWDDTQGLVHPKYTYKVGAAAAANPTTGYEVQYAKTVDANNDGFFVKRKINGAVVEVQL
jgi:hypothetical protein